MDLGLAGRVVLVTGASGGIGRAVADAFLAEGARVALHAHSRPDAVRGHPAVADGRAIVVAGDLRDPAVADVVVGAAVDAFGRLDVLVPAAGIWPAEDRPLHRMDIERVRAVLDVNLAGVLWTCRSFLAALERGGPHSDGGGAAIVLIGSTAGRFGEAGHAAYAASKGALRAVGLTLKNEITSLDPAGRVNLVEPGWTATPLTRGVLDEPGALDRLTRTQPLRRVAGTGDIARTVVFLASPAAAHITGEMITVAGGMEGRVQRG